MTIKEAQKLLTKALLPLLPNAPKEAQLLLQHHLGCDELTLLLHHDNELQNFEALLALLRRRMENEPLEYITNKVSFYGEEFFIDKGALIPRPETELLVDEVLKRIDKNEALTIAEVGIGSGIISIILALYLPKATFVATDISQEALSVALKNIQKFGLEDRIKLVHSSYLDGIEEKIDYLVSNPPYIAENFALETNLSYEPQNALFGGKRGSEMIEELLELTLKKGIKYFSCEMGYDQKDTIQNFMQGKNYKDLTFYKDYSGFDRGFTLEVF